MNIGLYFGNDGSTPVSTPLLFITLAFQLYKWMNYVMISSYLNIIEGPLEGRAHLFVSTSNLAQNRGEEKRWYNALGITRGPFEREGERRGVFEYFSLVKAFELYIIQ